MNKTKTIKKVIKKRNTKKYVSFLMKKCVKINAGGSV